MNSYPQEGRDDYRKNHGVPGVVYVLDNPGLRAGIYKIGCSRHSGAVRADALNKDANTGTPGEFRCVFEFRTLDCGRAEESVHEIFHDKRRGKFGKKLGKNERGTWGQEFFEVDLAEAKETITQVCGSMDNATRKTKSVQIRASAPTTNAAKLSQSVCEAPIVIENPGNSYLSENQTTNQISIGVLGKLFTLLVNFIAALFGFGVSFVVGIFALIPMFIFVAFVLGAIGMVANLFVGESSSPPDPKPAQVTLLPVETSIPIENVFQGYPDTQPIPSDTDADGLGDTQNEADTVKSLRIVAEQGSAYVQNKLGIMYTEGQGVPQDVVEGARWFRMAAEQGHAEAQLNIGLAYFEGRGVPRNYLEAVKWLRFAAAQGNSDAETKLDTMNTESRNVPPPNVGKTVGEADNSVTKVRREEVTREQEERDRLKKLDGDECKISAECAGVLICAKVNPSLMQCMSSDAALKLLPVTTIHNEWGRE